MKYLAYLVLLIIFLDSCKKEENDDTPVTFPIKYCIINNGSDNISRIHLESTTYYPGENKTRLLFSEKSIYVDAGDSNHLNKYDSLVQIPDGNCYIGCTIYYKVTISSEDSLGTERHMVYNRFSTINNNSESRYSISWPEDSLLFE